MLDVMGEKEHSLQGARDIMNYSKPVIQLKGTFKVGILSLSG